MKFISLTMKSLFLRHLANQINRFNSALMVAVCVLFLAGGIYASDKMLIVIIDGARYSETFGDASHTYVPVMWNLSQQGTRINTFYNDSLTWTARAIPALWCGTWTGVVDTVYNGNSTQYSTRPSIFEYYRKQKNMPENQCFYVLKYLTSLWLPSFDSQYGPNYWPRYHSQGGNDSQVATQAQWVMNTYHPKFLWVYLADVDGAGHSGNWDDYTRAIQTADSIVGVLWNQVQADPFYRNSTNMFVTNDHGRHDDQHGGFSGHGDGCPGCRHIMFLAMGPDIKQNYASAQARRIPDMTVTACNLLGVDPERATGEVMQEILQPTALPPEGEVAVSAEFTLQPNFPNPFNAVTKIRYSLRNPGNVTVEIFNAAGQKVQSLFSGWQNAGSHSLSWNAGALPSGIYFYHVSTGEMTLSSKALLLK